MFHAEGLRHLGRRVVVAVADLVGVDVQVPLPTKVKTEPLVPPEVQTVVDPELKATVSPDEAVAVAV